jgi:hypothetical protein
MWAVVVYVLSVLVLMASSAVIGYVWRIRDERVNEVVNSEPLSDPAWVRRQRLGNEAWSTTLVSDHD